MTAQVVYLNRWLDCGDEELRKNNLMQIRINEAKAHFWYTLAIQRIDGHQAQLCYDRFIHANRDRFHLIKTEDDG